MKRPDHWDMRLVDSLDDLDEFITWIDSLDGLVSIDTETTGLEWWTYEFTRLVTFADDVQGWAVPVRWYGRPLMKALAAIRDKQLPVAFWNCKFDMHALEHQGFPVPHWHNVIDGKLMHHLLIPHERHGLKPAAGMTLGHWATAGQGLLKAEWKAMGMKVTDPERWSKIPVDNPVYWKYGIVDTLITQAMVREMGPQLRTFGLMPAFERAMHVEAVMYRAEVRGMRIDAEYADEVRMRWLKEAVALKDHLEASGLKNPNSNKQVQKLLESHGWRPEDFTKTGQAVLDKIVLGALREVYPELAPQIMRYKRLVKWISTYLDTFSSSGGRVHPSINTMAARTGRMSIQNPPLQTLPSKGSGGTIRRCVLPEKGHVFWAIDYDGQEARLFANYSKDPGMRAAYDAGLDLYTYVGQMVYQDPTMTKEHPLRSTCKIIMLAWSYGAGVDKLALASGLPPDEVVRFLKQLFTVFPNVRDLTGDNAIGGNYPGGPALAAKARLDEGGLAYINTYGGRRFSVPNEDELYKCVNGLMQGGGKDVLDKAIVRLDRAGLGDYITCPVHDEILFGFPEDDVDAPTEAAILMEDREWEIPLTVEATGPLPHWGAAYNFTEEDDE
ncbi:MAG: DNA polymerase [candidate division NC10 bacterium]